jgi:HEAT repeat protein
VPLLVRRLPEAPLGGQSLGFSLLQSYPRDLSAPAMHSLLAGRAPYLALAAAAWLWRSEDKSLGGKIVEAFGQARSNEERVMMLGQVHGIRDDKLTVSVRALLMPGTDSDVLDAALYWLQQADDAASRPVARALLAGGQLGDGERALVAAFLLGSGDLDASEAFAAAVAKAPTTVLYRLPRLLERAPRLDEKAIEALTSLLAEGTSSAQRTAVARILAKHPSPRTRPLLHDLLDSDDEALARAAFDALASQGALDPVRLQRLLSGQPQLALRAAEALRRLDDHSGLPRVLEIAAEPGRQRTEAVRILAGFRVKAAVPPLLAALDASDLQLRIAAFSGLQALLPSLFPYRRFDLSSTGYAPSAAEAERRAGRDKIAAWWQEASARLR